MSRYKSLKLAYIILQRGHWKNCYSVLILQYLSFDIMIKIQCVRVVFLGNRFANIVKYFDKTINFFLG